MKENTRHYRIKEVDHWPVKYVYKLQLLRYEFWIGNVLIWRIWKTVYRYETMVGSWGHRRHVESIYATRFRHDNSQLWVR